MGAKNEKKSAFTLQKIVLETLKGEKTLSEIAAENNVNPNLLSKWKKMAVAGLPTLGKFTETLHFGRKKRIV